MATVNDAADGLLTRIEKELDPTLEEAKTEFERLAKEVEKLGNDLASDWKELQDRVRSFAEAVATDQQELAKSVNEATKSLDDVEAEATNAIRQISAEQQQERTALDGFKQAVEGRQQPLADMAKQSAVDPATGLGQVVESVSSAMQKALGDAGALLEESLTQRLERLVEQFPIKASTAAEIFKKVPERLNEGYVEYATKLFTVHDLVMDEGFEKMEENGTEEVEEALGAVINSHTAEISRIIGGVGSFGTLLSGLGDSIEQSAGKINDKGREPLGELLESLEEAAEAAADGLDELKDWFDDKGYL